jgi:ClpP class serine protease
MKKVFYCAERDFLERYLKERASAKFVDFQAISDIYGNPIAIHSAGSDAAINEIYSVDGNTAYIRIEGPLSPEGPDLWDRFFGYNGTSYFTIQGAMERARADRSISRVVLDVDSPGGTLAGCDETWKKHKALASEKPTEVHAGSYLASAAYWISTPAKKILAACSASQIGSIGVLVATYDWSKWEEDVGIREVVITSSNAEKKHTDFASEQGRNTVKAQLDAIERIFYSRITEGRMVSAEYIAGHFGRGGMMVAKDPSKEHEDAIRVKMIDGLTSDTVSAINHGENEENIINTEEGASLEENHTPATAGPGGSAMTLQEFMAQNPAAKVEVDNLIAKAREEAKAEYSARVEKVMPIMQSTAYPANIKTLACQVLAGKEEMAAFTATVSTFDCTKEAANSTGAQEQTAELGAVRAEGPSFVSAAEKEFDAAVQAEINKRKAK